MKLILLEILTYNFVMSGLTVVALLVIWRHRHVPAVLATVLVMVGVAAAVAVMIGRVPLESLHLLCFGWFLHVPVVLSAAVVANRKTHPRWACVGSLVVLLLIFIAVDAFVIEPQWLEVTTVELASGKVTRPWRLVLIADLQTDELGAYERRVFDAVAQARPDLILMAGDYLQAPSEQFSRLRPQFVSFLKDVGLYAPAGIFAVQGNAESRGWPEIFADLPVTSLVETTECDVDELRLIGLSLRDSFDTQLKIDEDRRFQVVLGHGPDFALGNVQADLLLAGHTHGGQVRLPLIGPLITLSEIPRRWASGVTTLDERRTLIVSRGIGMERMGAPRLRFLCRPQLVIVDIRPATTAAATPREPSIGQAGRTPRQAGG